LPGFHVTPGYLLAYDAVRGHAASDAERACADFIEARREFAFTLEHARERGELRTRPTHGDPKIDNFLFDARDRAVSLIDLDTVQPGLIHADLGDCIRSACNRSGESPDNAAAVRFDLDTCGAILRGYVAAAGSSLTDNDRAYLYAAIRLIPFELGLRFLTDHFAGNRYFKVTQPGQNLLRARAQFRLTEDIERHAGQLHALIDTLADCG
jgi:aminoglycoside phosphotransferase (APT) family kinase protein